MLRQDLENDDTVVLSGQMNFQGLEPRKTQEESLGLGSFLLCNAVIGC